MSVRVSAARIKRRTILYAVIAIITLIVYTAVSFSACAIGDDAISDESGGMNIEFGENGMLRNGTEYYTYRVEEGYQGVISVNILKKSGRIDLDIYPTDHKEDSEYKGRDLDSATFSVILSKAGKYKVCITAKSFVGDYGISWKTEEIEGK